jgi:hypothetical protein
VGAGRGKEFGVVDVARVTSKLEWLGLLFVRVFLLLVASVFFFLSLAGGLFVF